MTPARDRHGYSVWVRIAWMLGVLAYFILKVYLAKVAGVRTP